MAKEEENVKRTFEYGSIKYAVTRPTVKQQQDANKLRSKTFNDALRSGDFLREQLDSELRKRGDWNDDREATYQGLRKEVLDYELALKKGGIKLSQAKDLALEMADKREEMIAMLSSRTELDNGTCEGQADSARFNFLFANCLVYEETGEKYFPGGLEEYIAAANDIVASKGATEFYYLISGTENLDDTLPENEFLKKFNFTDDKNRLVDTDGRLITRDGKHLDEKGRYVKWNEDGTSIFVDVEGVELNEDGEYNIETSPFLDEDGKPIVLESEKEPDKPKRKSRKKEPEEEPVAAE
tara:strand:+ start:307 stop:1197 length:891 start_codon:yes stop_codon:yes gene_type:complete